jgi:hypothetical protein
MYTLQSLMDAVMARQAIEDQADTFVRDLHRVANRLAYGQEPGTEDIILVKAADCYLNHLDDPAPVGFEEA